MINFAIKLAATVALEALQIGLQSMSRTKGPRLDELTVTVAEYGTPIARFLGARKFTCPMFHAEKLKEVEQNTKVKGKGTQTTYHYLGTFAVAISDNPIDKVLKIWFDDKLVYDATGTGPISYAGALGINLDSVMRIYTGTETQLPDPRYVTWCEAKYGPNSAPAYRGVSYLFFEELPLDNFGNRIPQVTVMAASGTGVVYPYDLRNDDTNRCINNFSPDGLLLYSINGNTVIVYDVPSRELISKAVFPSYIGFNGKLGVSNDFAYALSGNFFDLHLVTIDPHGGFVSYSGALTTDGAYRDCTFKANTLLAYPYNTNEQYGGIIGGSSISKYFTTFAPTHYFEDADNGTWWAVGVNTGDINLCIFSSHTAATTVDTTYNGGSVGMDNGNGHLVISQGGYLQLWDKTTMTKVSQVALSTTFDRQYIAFDNVKPGAKDIWIGDTRYSTQDLSVIETINIDNWINDGAFEFNTPIWDAVNDAIVCCTGGTDHIIWRYLHRVNNSGVTLSAVLNKMCDAAGLISANRITAACSQLVEGYSWTRGDVKSQMQPLLDIYDVDARPHDFSIEFLPRGGAPSGTVYTVDLAKNGDGPRYATQTAQDTDLPRVIRVNYADTGYDQQTNNTISPLPVAAVDSSRDQVIDMTTFAAGEAYAQQLSDRYMRREWNSRETITASLTEMELAREPGDLLTVQLDDVYQNVRLDQVTLVGGRHDWSFIRDETSFAVTNANATGSPLNRDPVTIVIPAPTQGFVVDTPYRTDSDADVKPILFTGAGSFVGQPFPGALIWEATGIPAVYDQLFATVPVGAVWGRCNGILATANPNLWDLGNVLNVTLMSGSLTSVAQADIDADPTLNMIVVGTQGAWEYINFTTATLQGDGSYNLSGFKRGRRGTDGAVGGHIAGEQFIFVGSLSVGEMGTSDVGGNFNFKPQSVGRSIDSSPTVAVAPFTGASLKPYSPASIQWSTDGTDMFGSITRRTRVGGSWVGGSTIPLSENSEHYEVDVYHAGVLKRTITVTGTNLFTYTGAQITTDGNTVGVAPSVNVYQMSDAVGRGFPLVA